MSTNVSPAPASAGNVAFRSDHLRPLHALCEEYPGLAEIFGMLRPIHLVMDTNIVIKELIFMTKSRRNAAARTNLREVLDSGVAETIAPTKMHEEVNRHIPRLALEQEVPQERLQQAWLELQARIEFCEVGECKIPGLSVADPDDLPFVKLYWISGADAVLTQDRDISIMGARTVAPDAILAMRDYARSKSHEVSFRVGGVLIVGLTIGAVVALLKVIGVALRSFFKLPVEVQVLLVGVVTLAALHPSTRKALSTSLSALGTSLTSPAGVCSIALGQLTLAISAAQSDLKAKQVVVESLIPRRSAEPSALAPAGLSINVSSAEYPDFVNTHSPRISPAVRTGPPVRRRNHRAARRSPKRRVPKLADSSSLEP